MSSAHQTDTDSLMMDSSALYELRKSNPELFGDQFGQFEIETVKKGVKETKFDRFYAIRPKVYAAISDIHGVKYRIKGISSNATLVDEEDVCDAKKSFDLR